MIKINLSDESKRLPEPMSNRLQTIHAATYDGGGVADNYYSNTSHSSQYVASAVDGSTGPGADSTGTPITAYGDHIKATDSDSGSDTSGD